MNACLFSVAAALAVALCIAATGALAQSTPVPPPASSYVSYWQYSGSNCSGGGIDYPIAVGVCGLVAPPQPPLNVSGFVATCRSGSSFPLGCARVVLSQDSNCSAAGAVDAAVPCNKCLFDSQEGFYYTLKCSSRGAPRMVASGQCNAACTVCNVSKVVVPGMCIPLPGSERSLSLTTVSGCPRLVRRATFASAAGGCGGAPMVEYHPSGVCQGDVMYACAF